MRSWLTNSIFNILRYKYRKKESTVSLTFHGNSTTSIRSNCINVDFTSVSSSMSKCHRVDCESLWCPSISQWFAVFVELIFVDRSMTWWITCESQFISICWVTVAWCQAGFGGFIWGFKRTLNQEIKHLFLFLYTSMYKCVILLILLWIENSLEQLVDMDRLYTSHWKMLLHDIIVVIALHLKTISKTFDTCPCPCPRLTVSLGEGYGQVPKRWLWRQWR